MPVCCSAIVKYKRGFLAMVLTGLALCSTFVWYLQYSEISILEWSSSVQLHLNVGCFPK